MRIKTLQSYYYSVKQYYTYDNIHYQHKYLSKPYNY